jgi:uncharacterized protein YbaR (Trm112 family)
MHDVVCPFCHQLVTLQTDDEGMTYCPECGVYQSEDTLECVSEEK